MTSHAFNYGDLKIFSGRAHPALAQEICAYLRMPLGELTLFNFSDGETYCQIDENVRGADVFVVQPTCSPVNDHVMELLILLDAFRRSSASRCCLPARSNAPCAEREEGGGPACMNSPRPSR